MDTVQQRRLNDLFEEGYKLKIDAQYLDGFVEAIYPIDDDATQFAYDSDVYSGRALTSIKLNEVSIYQQLDTEALVAQDGVEKPASPT